MSESTEYWFENGASGSKIPMLVASEEDALKIARKLYPNPNTEENPLVWVFRQDHKGEEDYALVPGGPSGEEFTWMPRSMWDEGGPLAPFFDETMTERK